MNTKLTCLLLDDEIPGLTYLKLLCDDIPHVEVIRSFNDPLVFLNEHEKYNADFYILDIEMPGINGLDLAQKLHKPIIFTTAYKEYAADAFDISAVDYIRKPVKKERLESAIEKLRKQPILENKKSALLPLNTHKGKIFMQVNTLVCISTSTIDSRDKVAIMSDGTEYVLKNYSLEKLLSELPASTFSQVNRKEIISLRFVSGFGNDFVECTFNSAKKQVQLSEAFRKEFLLKVKL